MWLLVQEDQEEAHGEAHEEDHEEGSSLEVLGVLEVLSTITQVL